MARKKGKIPHFLKERFRHRNLQKVLSLVADIVPKTSQGKEAKTKKLRRVLLYIKFLQCKLKEIKEHPHKYENRLHLPEEGPEMIKNETIAVDSTDPLENNQQVQKLMKIPKNKPQIVFLRKVENKKENRQKEPHVNGNKFDSKTGECCDISGQYERSETKELEKIEKNDENKKPMSPPRLEKVRHVSDTELVSDTERPTGVRLNKSNISSNSNNLGNTKVTKDSRRYINRVLKQGKKHLENGTFSSKFSYNEQKIYELQKLGSNTSGSEMEISTTPENNDVSLPPISVLRNSIPSSTYVPKTINDTRDQVMVVEAEMMENTNDKFDKPFTISNVESNRNHYSHQLSDQCNLPAFSNEWVSSDESNAFSKINSSVTELPSNLPQAPNSSQERRDSFEPYQETSYTISKPGSSITELPSSLSQAPNSSQERRDSFEHYHDTFYDMNNFMDYNEADIPGNLGSSPCNMHPRCQLNVANPFVCVSPIASHPCAHHMRLVTSTYVPHNMFPHLMYEPSYFPDSCFYHGNMYPGNMFPEPYVKHEDYSIPYDYYVDTSSYNIREEDSIHPKCSASDRSPNCSNAPYQEELEHPLLAEEISYSLNSLNNSAW